MAFPHGHKLWMNRKTHGAPRKFKTAGALWKKCIEYFEWVEDNPLIEEKAFCSDGVIKIAKLNKMRAMSLNGLYLFLCVDRNTWVKYKTERGDEFKDVCDTTETIIYEQKFSGAAASLLNPAIIVRELGLKDQIDHKVAGVLAHIDANDDPQSAAKAYIDFLNAGIQPQEP